MNISTGAASVLAAVFVMSNVTMAQAQSEKDKCFYDLKQVKEMQANPTPAIGPKATKMVDELVVLAEQRCNEGEYKKAGELMTTVRSALSNE